MGIDKYNALCRGIVMKYSGEWRSIMTKLGRWIDFDNDYKTLYPSFMESVWWVFKELHSKGLVYRGFKVMPFSTALATPLSNFEANQEMKEVVDPAVYVSFPIEGDADGAALLAWTTTPWTLPSNLALCVHPDFEYSRFTGLDLAPGLFILFYFYKKNPLERSRTGPTEVATGKVYIALKSLLVGSKDSLFKKKEDIVINDTFVGKTLVGRKYTPMFDYYPELRERAYRVVCDTYDALIFFLTLAADFICV
jgi:isoleucyl-tRNA synthetase